MRSDAVRRMREARQCGADDEALLQLYSVTLLMLLHVAILLPLPLTLRRCCHAYAAAMRQRRWRLLRCFTIYRHTLRRY